MFLDDTAKDTPIERGRGKASYLPLTASFAIKAPPAPTEKPKLTHLGRRNQGPKNTAGEVTAVGGSVSKKLNIKSISAL